MKYDQFIPSNTVCFDNLFKQYFIIQNKWIGQQLYKFSSKALLSVPMYSPYKYRSCIY